MSELLVFIGGYATVILIIGSLSLVLWRQAKFATVIAEEFLTVQPSYPVLFATLSGFGMQIIVSQVFVAILAIVGMPGRAPVIVSFATVPVFASVHGAAAMAVYKLVGGEKFRLLTSLAVFGNVLIYGILFIFAIRTSYAAHLIPEDLYKKLWGMNLMPPSAKYGILFLFLFTQAYLTWFAAILTAHINFPVVKTKSDGKDIPFAWRIVPVSLLAGLPLATIGFIEFYLINSINTIPTYLSNFSHVIGGILVTISSAIMGPTTVITSSKAASNRNWQWRAFFGGGSAMAYLWIAELFWPKPDDVDSGFIGARILNTLINVCIWVPAFGFVGVIATFLFIKRSYKSDRSEAFELEDVASDFLLEDEQLNV